ncbi:unnamed protein product [Hydatigera taeniaeformis]|uniref:REJ domain-containing protein n=1 Tax=Hydatigena taeniaeformis TaxID=6205 RepID=A0A0R3X1T7_HYDTA|nr:unnamed protein product [Hydatigera taeniaeformis]
MIFARNFSDTLLPPSECPICRHGASCDQPYNNPPTFWKSAILVVTESRSYAEPVAQIVATDIDLCAPSKEQRQGDCQVINYSLYYTQDEQDLFNISSNGEVFFKSLQHFKIWKSKGISSFSVLARNAGEFAADFSSTHVKVVSGSPSGVSPMRPNLTKPPLLTILPSTVEPTSPGFGTFLTLCLCLPFGDPVDGFLRLRGLRSGGRFLTGGSLRIIGVGKADANVHLSSANQTVSAKYDIETEMALGRIKVSSRNSSNACNRLDINAVVIAPPSKELQSPIKALLEVTVAVTRSEIKLVQIPFTIVKSGVSPSYKPSLSDVSNNSVLVPGVYSQVHLAVRTVLEGQYQLDIKLMSKNMEIHKTTIGYPKGITATAQLQEFGGTVSLILYTSFNYLALVPNYSLPLSSFMVRFNLLVTEHSSETYDLDVTLKLKAHHDFKKLRLSFRTTDWPGNPYDLKLSIVNVETREGVQHPLQSGETVLVLMEFRIPGKSTVDYTATVSIVDSQSATLGCPYFESVGKSIFLDEATVDCTTKDITDSPLLKYSYHLGPAICDSDTDNKINLGIYMRIKATPFKGKEVLTLRGVVEGLEVTKSLSISDESPRKLGFPFLDEDLSLRFSGPHEVEMYSRETLTLQLYFCSRPGVYINNLSFEALSEFSPETEEVITINCISFNRSVNIVGLQFPQSQEQVSFRKPSGQIFSRKIGAGPAYNTGYGYKKKNRLPKTTDDCIGIEVTFQLADAEEVYSGAVYPVLTKIFNDDQLLLKLRVSVKVIDQPSPTLNVEIRFINVKRNGSGKYILDLELSIAKASTLECHDAAIWLMHGGFFNVSTVKMRNSVMKVDLAPLPSGTGISLVKHGGVYFDSTGIMTLALKQRIPFKVKGNLGFGVIGILRCRTYDRSLGSKIRSYEPPTFFQNHALLPIEVGDAIAPLSHIHLRLCQVRGCGNVEDLFYESGMDKFWNARADSRLDILFGQSVTIDILTIRIKSKQNWPTSMHVLTTGDGNSFLFQVEKSLAFPAAALETNVSLNSLPQHRGLRLIIKNAYYEHENLDIKMAFFGTYGLKMMGDFDLGPQIAQVVSYIRSKNVMLGISLTKDSYLMSNDSGDSWTFIDRGYFTSLRFSNDSIPVVPIPSEKISESFKPTVKGKQCTNFVVRNWHFCYSGVYYGDTGVLEWNYRSYL